MIEALENLDFVTQDDISKDTEEETEEDIEADEPVVPADPPLDHKMRACIKQAYPQSALMQQRIVNMFYNGKQGLNCLAQNQTQFMADNYPEWMEYNHPE